MTSPLGDCTPAEIFASISMNPSDWKRTLASRITRRSLLKGEVLYHAGQAFKYLSAVRTGYFKSQIVSKDGELAVSGFHLPGDLLGADGLYGGIHEVDVVALVDSEVCHITADEVRQLMSEVAAVERFFHQFLLKDIHRMRSFMTALSERGADQRLATFLIDFGKRLYRRGYSDREFHLPMTRADIAAYLLLQHETVSRSFTSLIERRFILVNNRNVKILQPEALGEFRRKK